MESIEITKEDTNNLYKIANRLADRDKRKMPFLKRVLNPTANNFSPETIKAKNYYYQSQNPSIPLALKREIVDFIKRYKHLCY